MCDAFALGSKMSSRSYLNKVTVERANGRTETVLSFCECLQSACWAKQSVGEPPRDGACLWGMPLVPAGWSRVLGSPLGMVPVSEACPSFLLGRAECWEPLWGCYLSLRHAPPSCWATVPRDSAGSKVAEKHLYFFSEVLNRFKDPPYPFTSRYFAQMMTIIKFSGLPNYLLYEFWNFLEIET